MSEHTPRWHRRAVRFTSAGVVPCAVADQALELAGDEAMIIRMER